MPNLSSNEIENQLQKIICFCPWKISHYVIFHRIFPLKWKAVLRRSKLFTVSPSEQLLIESNYFDATVIISEQLSLQSSYFFSRLTSSRQLFCRIAHFSNGLLFQNFLIFITLFFTTTLPYFCSYTPFSLVSY